MRLYAEFVGDWDARHGDYRWHSLTAAATRSGLGAFEGHDAFRDAVMTLRLLRHMASGGA